MHSSFTAQGAPSPAIAHEVVALFTRLGLDAIVRDPDSVEVLASTPGAETRVLAAEPGSVRIATVRLNGTALRVELVSDICKTMPLSGRQLEVARCLAKGMRNHQIAKEMNISLHTVRRHLEQMFRRLGVHSRKEVVAALQLETKIQ